MHRSNTEILFSNTSPSIWFRKFSIHSYTAQEPDWKVPCVATEGSEPSVKTQSRPQAVSDLIEKKTLACRKQNNSAAVNNHSVPSTSRVTRQHVGFGPEGQMLSESRRGLPSLLLPQPGPLRTLLPLPSGHRVNLRALASKACPHTGGLGSH